MPAFQVHKKIVINAPAIQVFELVRDFKTWPSWSPWLICDPDAELSFDPDEKGYSWEGPVSGSGGMRIESEEKFQRIEYDLRFLKPWKSQAKFQFEFEEVEGGTEVSWKMQSSLPIFMFFMKSMMVAMIGMDYDRGLAMLKDFAETGTVPSKLVFGDASFEPRHFVGVKSSCATADIGSSMERDFARLHEWISEANPDCSGPPFAIYHKWDLVKGSADYTLAIPVPEPKEELPDGLFNGSTPTMKTYTVRHTGPYRHLANAWSAGMMRGRSGLFKQRKGVHPFEIYETEPGSVPENETVTVVHFPIKEA